jgi:hypothetical protein
MGVPQGFQRAKLEIEGQEAIECAFNPQSYSVSKTNVWNFKPTTGVDLPDGEFGGGLPQRTALSLLLDVSLLGEGESVKIAADKLFKMMESGGGGGGGGAPPKVTFRWGSVNLPQSVPVALTVQYVHFHPNGEPIRATVDLELAQAMKAEQGQNPTTRGVAGRRVHRVQDGDSLASLAFEAYRDATRWREIAAHNDIDDPTRLRRGTELSIPRIDA